MNNTSFEILHSFIDSIAVLNKKGEIVFTNKAWKEFSKNNKGTIKKTDCGNNYLQVCEGTKGPEVLNAKEARKGIELVLKRKKDMFEMEYPCHSKSEKRWFILRVMPYYLNTNYSIVSHINVTTRKLAEEQVDDKNQQLLKINQQLNTTFYRVVHDIQSPLSSILTLMQISKEENEIEEIIKHLHLVETSVSNLTQFIQSTLSLSFNSKNTDIIDFKQLVKTYFDAVQYHPNIQKITIKKEILQNVEFRSDVVEVTSIISNVISNSIKYFDEKKQNSFINIKISVNSKQAVIIIKDNGIGIQKSNLSKIFVKNFQENKKSKKGVGLGLNLVKTSIENMNGKISVKSEKNIGTEFKITIPNLKS